MSLAMPIGLILSGFFADKIGVNHWFLLSGILIIFLCRVRKYHLLMQKTKLLLNILALFLCILPAVSMACLLYTSRCV